MNTFMVRQRFPNFFSGFIPIENEIQSFNELCEISYIKRWMNEKNFKRIFKEKRNREQHLIGIELLDGSKWIIAFIWGDIDKLEMEEELYRWRKVV